MRGVTVTLASTGRPNDPLGVPVVEAQQVSRRFREHEALIDVDFTVARGEIHALLGRNGAGKTTLLRLLTGLQEPTSGQVRLTGAGVEVTSRQARARIGFVPSGDRSFYNRISGFENLLFFARLNGMRRRQAAARSTQLLADVGLAEAAKRPVGEYSHGMQKRLGVARGLLLQPELLLVDEATHDLDPEGAQRVRSMITEAAAAGAAVVWTTQRVDEIRGFARRVTVLDAGRVRFVGTVPELLAVSPTNYYELRPLTADGGPVPMERVSVLVGTGGVFRASTDPHHVVVELADGVILGEVLAAIGDAGLRILACREERSEVEQALLRLGSTEATP
jgi:ABC-2 type transport system ATP-binding protein